MSGRMVYTCDVCGVDRKQTNHWFWGEAEGGGVHLYPWDASFWDESRDKTVGFEAAGVHLCGVSCSLRWVQSQLPLPEPREQSNA